MIESVYRPLIQPFELSTARIPVATTEAIHAEVTCLTKCTGSVLVHGNEHHVGQFVAAVLKNVCVLFCADDGEVRLESEEWITGDYFKAHGRFDFAVKRNGEALCIIEVKKGDVEQGLAQNLVQMEASVDMDHLDTVCGIVTDFLRWVFLISSKDKVQQNIALLEFDRSEVPTKKSLEEIDGRVYSLLSSAAMY